MDELRWQQRLQNLNKAFISFKSIHQLYLNSPDSEVHKLALIQAFEFTFELSWKILKDYLLYQGIEVGFPREVIKKSFQLGLLTAGQDWIDMLAERNQLSHEYDEKKVLKIVERITNTYFLSIQQLINELAKKIC